MSCGQHPDVNGNRFVTADALDLTLLQHAQQRDLNLRRKIADLVQENRPAIGRLKAP